MQIASEVRLSILRAYSDFPKDEGAERSKSSGLLVNGQGLFVSTLLVIGQGKSCLEGPVGRWLDVEGRPDDYTSLVPSFRWKSALRSRGTSCSPPASASQPIDSSIGIYPCTNSRSKAEKNHRDGTPVLAMEPMPPLPGFEGRCEAQAYRPDEG